MGEPWDITGRRNSMGTGRGVFAYVCCQLRKGPISIHGMVKEIKNNTFDPADKEHMVYLLEMYLFFCATRVSFSELPASSIVQYGTLVA